MSMVITLTLLRTKMISNDRLGSAVQDGQDLIGIKILSDKAHLPFLEAILIPAHNLWPVSASSFQI